MPARPDLSLAHPEFLQRVESCEGRVRTQDDPQPALAELARLYHANGFLPEASACYASLEVLEPKQPRWPHLHAHILAGYGKIEAAAPRWARVVELAPDYLPARLRRADLSLKSGQLDRAEKEYAAVLARNPDNPYALLGLARCDFEREHWEEAREKLERLVRATNFKLGYDLIVTVFEKLGLAGRALDVRSRERASGAFRDPADPWVQELLLDCYDSFQLSLAAGAAADAGDRKRAIELLERATSLDPESAALRVQLGSILFVAGEYSKARPLFERATELAPEFADGWSNLSNLQLTVGQREAAQRTLERAMARNPNSPILRIMHARQLSDAGRKEAAIKEFREAIRLRPTEADAYIQLSFLLIALEREDEAMQVLEDALIYEPQHPVLLTTLALHAVQSGNEAAARNWWSRIREQPRVADRDKNVLRREFQAKFGRPLE